MPRHPSAFGGHRERAGGEFLDLLRQENDLDWTFLSPSVVMPPANEQASSGWARISFGSSGRTREASPHP
jgi:putative NADH-flavin reductase